MQNTQTSEKIKPSKAWFALPPVIFIIGITLFIFLVMSAINTASSSTPFTLTPNQSSTITVLDPGKYEIYYEYWGYSSPNLPGKVNFMLTNNANEEVLYSQPSTFNSNYSSNNKSGVLVATVDITSAGTYNIFYDLTDTSTDYTHDFVIGKNIVGNTVGRIFGAIASMFFAIFGAIISIVVISVFRNKNRRKQNAEIFQNQAPVNNNFYNPPPNH